VQPSRAELASWDFVLVQYVVRHPWPFLLVLGGCLVALSAVFCLQVKLAYFDWASLPVDSPLRPAFESLLYDFRGAGKSDLQLFLQTGPDLRVTNESFVRALDSLCSQLEQQWFVSDVGSMVRLDANLSVADYVDIYAAPASAGNIGYSQQWTRSSCPTCSTSLGCLWASRCCPATSDSGRPCARCARWCGKASSPSPPQPRCCSGRGSRGPPPDRWTRWPTCAECCPASSPSWVSA